MSIARSSEIWGSDDGATLEAILSGVSENAIPRIQEVVHLLSQVLNHDPDAVLLLDPCDSVLTDALRCILCHQWIVPSIQRPDGKGGTVAAFFTQPFAGGRVLSLFSSQTGFGKLQKAAKTAGANLSPVQLTFGQIMMAHLPNMTVEAMQKHNVAESNAVRALSIDHLELLGETKDETQIEDDIVLFSDKEFSLLQNFCRLYRLAGCVLEAQADLAAGPSGVKVDQWEEIMRTETYSAVMCGDSVFASEAGMLFCCYPGDATKVLKYHQRKGTLGLTDGKVTAIDPRRALDLMRWQAGEGKPTLIVATVMEASGDLQMHGLSVTAQVFLEGLEPALAHSVA